MKKGEIAWNKQFLLLSRCFLPYMALVFHFKCTSKCRLQFVSIWTSLKFFSSGNKLNQILVTSNFFFFFTTFSTYFGNFPSFSLHLKLSSANYFSLEEPKICCFGNYTKNILSYNRLNSETEWSFDI